MIAHGVSRGFQVPHDHQPQRGDRRGVLHREKSRNRDGVGGPGLLRARLRCKGAEPDAILTPASLKTQRRQDMRRKASALPHFASWRLCVSQFVSFVLFVVKEPEIPEPRMTQSPRILPSTPQRLGNGGSRKKRKRAQKQSVVCGAVLMGVWLWCKGAGPHARFAQDAKTPRHEEKGICSAPLCVLAPLREPFRALRVVRGQRTRDP
jgi:hypothetical protein